MVARWHRICLCLKRLQSVTRIRFISAQTMKSKLVIPVAILLFFTFVYTASAADVLTVVVGGRVIVENGQHAFGPVAPLMREALSLIRDAS